MVIVTFLLQMTINPISNQKILYQYARIVIQPWNPTKILPSYLPTIDNPHMKRPTQEGPLVLKFNLPNTNIQLLELLLSLLVHHFLSTGMKMKMILFHSHHTGNIAHVHGIKNYSDFVLLHGENS